VRYVISRAYVISTAALLLGCAERPVTPLTAADDASAAKAGGSQLETPSNPTAVSSGQGQIDVTWQDNSNDESQFEVHRSTDGAGGTFSLLSSAGKNVTTLRDDGLVAGTQYCYVIRAVRLRGSTATFSPFSAAACAVTDPIPPPPPPPAPISASEATATAMNSFTIGVRWTAVSSSETQFRIERSTDGGALWIQAGTASPYERSFTDAGVQSERAVCYRVVALNTSGTALPSNTACATPPSAPTSLIATLVDPQTWELGWTDNSTVEDGYEVWAYSMWIPCCGSGGGGEGCESGYSEGDYLIARLPANSTVYRTPVDSTLGDCGTTEFWVRATNGTGFSTFATYPVTP
jgi:hypothetical protein